MTTREPLTSSGPQQVVRLAHPDPQAPASKAVIVPAAAATYYLSGTLPEGVEIGGAKGTEKFYGDTEAQVSSVLSRAKETLAALGLTFADVVMAQVFLVADPAKKGAIDYAGLNTAWAKEFGTANQPNKPARCTVEVSGFVAPGTLVEIAFVAARA